MAKNLKLLLVENVENLGIVGDVVNVRTGYARNFLLPRSLATQPSDDKIKELAGKRAAAQKQLEAQRQTRVDLNGKLQGVELTLIRSCNDQGILYGAISQQDLAASLKELGHVVAPRDVRIPQTIKRVDSFDVHIKLDSDLDAHIKVHIKPDRELSTAAAPAPEAEAPAGAGADEGGKSRRRDAWMVPDESNRVVGWGPKKEEGAPASDSGEQRAKKADGGEKKGGKKAASKE